MAIFIVTFKIAILIFQYWLILKSSLHPRYSNFFFFHKSFHAFKLRKYSAAKLQKLCLVLKTAVLGVSPTVNLISKTNLVNTCRKINLDFERQDLT